MSCKKYIIKFVNFLYEIFRIIVGCFFVTLSPQICNKTLCTFTQNIFQNDVFHIVAIASNFLTFIYVIYLYIIEYKRENFINKYIKNNYANIDTNIDNTSFDAKNKLNKYNKKYYNNSQIALSSFCINFIISFISLAFYNIYFYTFISMFAFGLLLFNKL